MMPPLQAPRQLATAASVSLPVLASENLDGIRCLVNVPGAATALTTRSGKAVRNRWRYHRLAAENLALRHQLIVLSRSVKRGA